VTWCASVEKRIRNRRGAAKLRIVAGQFPKQHRCDVIEPELWIAHQRVSARRATGDEMLTDIARSYNVSHSAIRRA
jgi:hypothetical protein